MLMSIVALAVIPATAQDEEATMTPETVAVEAADGLELVGDFYAAPTEDTAPALLLMHMLGSDRSAYEPLIPALLEAGYNVLNVDLRGHGDSGTTRDWDAATADVALWLDWLREQGSVDPDAVALLGASIGSNLALIGCAADDACMTAVALSPGLEYRGVMPENAVVEGLAERSALLVASHGDDYAADSVRQMFAGTRGDIAVRLYSGRAHGTNLFRDKLDSVSGLILAWLDEHLMH